MLWWFRFVCIICLSVLEKYYYYKSYYVHITFNQNIIIIKRNELSILSKKWFILLWYFEINALKTLFLVNIVIIRIVYQMHFFQIYIYWYVIKCWNNFNLDKKNFEDYIFDLHNTARTRHGLLLLERDTKVSKIINYIYLLYKQQISSDVVL